MRRAILIFLVLWFACSPGLNADFDQMKRDMIEIQLKARGIHDERVLKAVEKVPRHLFVPESLYQAAYADGPLPIGYEQTISQPYIVAFMTENLQVLPTDKVLEIGTGSGYQAAVLAELAKEVYTIEIVEPLYDQATKRLHDLGYKNVHTRLGDGWTGWPEEAPFDKIIVTAAADKLPQKLVDQLREGGRMIFPLGAAHETQFLILGVKHRETFEKIETIPVRFVPLIHGTQEAKEKDSKA